LRSFGVARSIIAGFAALLFLTAALHEHLDFPELVGQSLRRIGMNGVLVVALLPSIRSGLGPNFGLPVGILAGLIGTMLAMEHDLTGSTGFVAALGVGIALAIPLGILYGMLLNAVRGKEMVVGIYVGFATVALASVFWVLAPFRNAKLIWPLGGSGLRTTRSMDDYWGGILDRFLEFELLGVNVPTGLLLFGALCCGLVAAFFRTRVGLAVSAAGSNPEFARAAGIRPARMRIVGATFSTVLGAVGIIVYAQSLGIVQLYGAPMFMALPAVAAVLLGGASLTRASLAHVVVGVTLFQTILTLSMPLSNEVIGGNELSETMRLGIQNGMILYALTRRGGA
jgi:simple sugar transport system permease protein